MTTLRFRTQLFLAAFGAMAIAVGIVALLESWSVRAQIRERIERTLVTQARLVAELLAHHLEASPAQMDVEADSIGAMLDARVTLIADDGTVVGDSTQDGAELAALENHGVARRSWPPESPDSVSPSDSAAQLKSTCSTWRYRPGGRRSL